MNIYFVENVILSLKYHYERKVLLIVTENENNAR